MVPLVALTVPFADAARRKPGRQMGCNRGPRKACFVGWSEVIGGSLEPYVQETSMLTDQTPSLLKKQPSRHHHAPPHTPP